MDKLNATNNKYLNRFLSFTGGFSYIANGTLLLLVSAVFLFFLFVIYNKIRGLSPSTVQPSELNQLIPETKIVRKLPATVNCWFCNKNTKVPYEQSNSWDCPHCQQYNGFNKDGGYNKVIKEQYNSKLNENIFNTLKPTFGNSFNTQTNGFCKLCNINQQLKIQQLALFVPLDENNYYEEIEQYRNKLEKAYKLCSNCEKTLQETLEKQGYNLLQNRLNSQKQKISLPSQLNIRKLYGEQIYLKLKKIIPSILRWCTTVTAVVLFIALLHQFETENQFMYLTLPHLVILEPLQPTVKGIFGYLDKIHLFRKELSFAGFFLSLLCLSERQTKVNNINLLVWGLLHILLWSKLTGFQALMSVVSVYFNNRAIHTKPIYLNRKVLPKKYTFQPEKRVFPDSFSFPSDDPVNRPASPVIKNDSFESDSSNNGNVRPQERSKKLLNSLIVGEEKIKKEKKKEDEVESPLNEEKENIQVKPDSSNLKFSPSVFNKSFLSTLEEEKKEEAEPLDQVYNNLNSLTLGGKQKKSKKPSNFLFSNNFSDKKLSSSSIIKPAKFIKNLSNSWTGAESNESASRSSTPSSGYSSQKTENPNRYDFSKTISPISVHPFGRHSPRDCFDYYDGNGYYSNLNCFSPGFVPFQQFAGPIGHTTIYTCTRPTNFSFPFAHWQGFPPYNKYSPSSPRFFDVSDSENLFQNASRSFNSSKKWFKLKTISYYFSIVLNIITLLGLVYFISTGIILVDWKLPKFNFFV